MSFTRIPNEIIDFYMGKLSHAQFKVLIFILRKTLGWNKKSDIISLSQITSACGISKPTAVTALKELNDMGLISTKKNTKVGKKISLGGKIVLLGVLNSFTSGSKIVLHTKDILNKEERKNPKWKPHSF